MKGYWIVLGSDVTDPAAQEEYIRRWKPIAEKYGAKVNQTARAPELVEPNGATRTLIVEFPNIAEAIACYEDADYQEAAAFAHKAAKRSLLILEGAL